MDPLTPFATLIRSLWTEKSERARQAQAAAASTGAPAPPSPVRGAVERMQPRLAAMQEWDAARARELFVEHVLLDEISDGLGQDPQFAELVRRVSVQIGSEPKLSARLDEILQQLAADARS